MNINLNSLAPSRLPFKVILICNRLNGVIASYEQYGVDLGSCRRQIDWAIYELDQLQRRCRCWSSRQVYSQIQSKLKTDFSIEKLGKLVNELSQSHEVHEQQFVGQIKQALTKYRFQLRICEEQLDWRYGDDRGWRPIQAEAIAVY